MSTQYVGMCVGGPMAGQSVVQPHQRFQAKSTLRQALNASLSDAEVDDHFYNWHHLGPFAIWIHQSMTINDALNDMAVAYAEKHHVARRA